MPEMPLSCCVLNTTLSSHYLITTSVVQPPVAIIGCLVLTFVGGYYTAPVVQLPLFGGWKTKALYSYAPVQYKLYKPIVLSSTPTTRHCRILL